jgi:putative endonuclease
VGIYVYVLGCADGSYYVGQASDLTRRLAEHMAGEGGPYTSGRLPVRLIYSEECSC